MKIEIERNQVCRHGINAVNNDGSYMKIDPLIWLAWSKYLINMLSQILRVFTPQAILWCLTLVLHSPDMAAVILNLFPVARINTHICSCDPPYLDNLGAWLAICLIVSCVLYWWRMAYCGSNLAQQSAWWLSYQSWQMYVPEHVLSLENV